MNAQLNSPLIQLNLHADEVHVWRAHLKQPDDLVARLEKTLSPDEEARLARLRIARVRRHFIVGRGVLRDVLGRYLDIVPGAVAFTYGSQGKPALAANESGLQFNLSHSGEMALVAVTRNREIGVDLEKLRPMSDAEQIACRFFSPNESACFLDLPPNQRNLAFFACWTRKEAYLKALGDGITCGLDTFDVAFAPGEEARLLRVEGEPEPWLRWGMAALYPAAGYVAALVAAGNDWRLRCLEWTATADG